jgi:3-dehydroquinate synthase
VLKTVPRREFNQGFAEIIKHTVIADAKMLRTLQVAPAFGLRRASGTHALLSIIKRNVEIKSKIVAKDEWDQSGNRAILNFGHTVGHAIERAGGYCTFLHGEAVSLGMVAACTVSMNKAGLPPAQRDVIVDLLRKFDLPTRLPPNFPRKKILDVLKFDKKFEGGNVRFVVTPRIGVARLAKNVTLGDIREAIEQL